MVINLKDIRIAGKTEEDFEFFFSPTENLCDIPGVEIVNPIKISGRIYLTGKLSAFIEGEIKFTLKGECTACLAETTREYEIEFEQDFSPENDDGYTVKRDSVDLTKPVMDEVVLNMPMNFNCNDCCDKEVKMEF